MSGKSTYCERVSSFLDGGKYYYVARYYDPDLGRFTQPDTLLDGLNRYAYVQNNPVKYTDPTGHDTDYYDDPYGFQGSPEEREKEKEAYNREIAEREKRRERKESGGTGVSPIVVENPSYLNLIPGYTEFGYAETFLNDGAYLHAGAWYLTGVVEQFNAVALGWLVGSGTKSILSNLYLRHFTIGSGSTLILGNYPQYLNRAKELEARAFSMPTKVWDIVQRSETFTWLINKKVLDIGIKRGWKFFLESPIDDIHGQSYVKEIQYLLENGIIKH